MATSWSRPRPTAHRLMGLLTGTSILWTEPHRRVAAGQSVVFYVGDEVVGGGIAE